MHCWRQDKCVVFHLQRTYIRKLKVRWGGAFLNETLITGLVAIVKCSTLTFVRGTLLKQLEGAAWSANGQRIKHAKHNHRLIRTNKCEYQFTQMLLQYCSVLYCTVLCRGIFSNWHELWLHVSAKIQPLTNYLRIYFNSKSTDYKNSSRHPPYKSFGYSLHLELMNNWNRYWLILQETCSHSSLSVNRDNVLLYLQIWQRWML